jgi:hypothetical protein
MKRAQAALSFLLIFFLFFPRPLPVEGEESRLLISIAPFTVEGPGVEESFLIESLIRSYLSDFGDVVNPTGSGGALESFAEMAGISPVSPARNPDYILSGSIYLDRDSRIFTLEIVKTATGEISSSITVHRTTGELLLKARSLVEAIFSPGGREKRREESRPEPMTEQGVLGAWRGEPGIEMVLLYPGGRGLALFSSGAQMLLSYRIEHDTLRLRQNSPNMERFYYYYLSAPSQARRLAGDAEPMRWDLQLYEQGGMLRGNRTFSGFDEEGGAPVPGLTQPVEWKRTH